MKTYSALLLALLGVPLAFGFSTGPPARRTAGPGDNPLACTSCHAGTLNSGAGSVKIILPNGPVYTPGVKQRIQVQVSDPAQRRWGFQLSARLDSDQANGRAGDLAPSDSNTQIRCDSGNFGTCKAGEIQFIEHTQAGTRNGTPNGATFEFDWTPPAAGAGTVIFFAAGNAANGDGTNGGDHIYTTNVRLDVAAPPPALPVTKYAVTNLVSDIAGFAAQTDPNLVNPWGIALSPTSPFWVSDNRSGVTTLYNGAGALFPVASPIVAKIPGGKPTGQVFNGTATAFLIAPGKAASFIFSTETGFIAGWNSTVDPANAAVLVDNSGSGAVYKGLAIGTGANGPMLFAANFNAGTIDVFDAGMKPVMTAGGFQDPNLPAGFAPFNIQRFGRSLYVTYAMQDSLKQNDMAGAGNGYINVFDLDGNLRKRFASGGALNSPWGLAMAPGFFGDYSGTLLVGNFGDGTINAYEPASGDWLGTLQDKDGNPIAIPGLWGLIFGNGKANGGDANTLYFAAGIAGPDAIQSHGLFGSLTISN